MRREQTPAPWIVQGFWLGLPPEGASAVAARGDAAVPIQMGDITIARPTRLPRPSWQCSNQGLQGARRRTPPRMRPGR